MAKLTMDIPEPQRGEEDATQRQKQYIYALIQEAGASGLPDDVIEQLGKWQASAVIDQLKRFKDEVTEFRSESPVDVGHNDSWLMANVGKPILIFAGIVALLWLVF